MKIICSLFNSLNGGIYKSIHWLSINVITITSLYNNNPLTIWHNYTQWMNIRKPHKELRHRTLFVRDFFHYFLYYWFLLLLMATCIMTASAPRKSVEVGKKQVAQKKTACNRESACQLRVVGQRMCCWLHKNSHKNALKASLKVPRTWLTLAGIPPRGLWSILLASYWDLDRCSLILNVFIVRA